MNKEKKLTGEMAGVKACATSKPSSCEVSSLRVKASFRSQPTSLGIARNTNKHIVKITTWKVVVEQNRERMSLGSDGPLCSKAIPQQDFFSCAT